MESRKNSTDLNGKIKNKKVLKIYPSITTTANNYLSQINEINKLKIDCVCFFPTCIDYGERIKVHKLLENSCIKEIPLVHIRHDMHGDELEYYSKRFKTKVFNIHSRKDNSYIMQNDLSKFLNEIYVETTLYPLENEPDKYAGVCLDAAHVENQRLKRTKLYTSFMQSLKKYPIGVAHISAVGKTPRSKKGSPHFDKHKFVNLDEFDYVLNYVKYLPKIVALELENPINEQLEVKSYLENLLDATRS